MEGTKRSPNFTSAEKTFLFRLISEKYASILEDKKTDRASLQKRDQTWNLIQKEFNAVSPSNVFRGVEALTKLYSNKKKEVRKKVAEEKKEVLLTGGGLPPNIDLKDECDLILLSIMNEKTVHGLKNPYDSDANLVTEITTATNEVEFVFGNTTKKITDKCEYVGKSQSPEPSTLKSTINEKYHIPKNLKTSNNPLLEMSGNLSQEDDPIDVDKAKDDYTPSRKSRRRPTATVKTLTSSIVAQKYNLLLDKRLTLVEKQIKHSDEEHTLNMKKRKLEVELLELQLELKKEQKKMEGIDLKS